MHSIIPIWQLQAGDGGSKGDAVQLYTIAVLNGDAINAILFSLCDRHAELVR